MVAVHASIRYQNDPYNHTRWKHKWRWHNRGCVWENQSTEWAGKEDWTSKRKYQALEDKKNSLPSRLIV